MKNVSQNLRAKDYASLTTAVLTLISAIGTVEHGTNKINERARELGLDLTHLDNETQVSYLNRLAIECTYKEHDLLKTEALDIIKETTNGHMRQGPKTRLGRLFTSVARLVG